MARIKILLVLVVAILISGCGGGGSSSTSDADRFIGDWYGSMIETGNDYGGELDSPTLHMHIEYAGKDTIAGITMEYISVSIFLDDVLFAAGVITAIPGGVWNLDISGADYTLTMLGQFSGNSASGSWDLVTNNPDPPYEQWTIWGTWSATR